MPDLWKRANAADGSITGWPEQVLRRSSIEALQLAQECLREDKAISLDAARMVELLKKDDGTMCSPNAASCVVKGADAGMAVG